VKHHRWACIRHRRSGKASSAGPVASRRAAASGSPDVQGRSLARRVAGRWFGHDSRDGRSPRRSAQTEAPAAAGRPETDRSGKTSRKMDPRPTVLSTSAHPPWTRAMCLTMARPRPVPPIERLRARSTR